MSEEGTEYPTTGHDELPPSIDKIIATHRLARNIDAAHQNGALLLLAMQLEPLVEQFHAKNRPLTTVELEGLITVAARAMVGE